MKSINLSEKEQSFLEKGLQEVTDGKIISGSWFLNEEPENWPYWTEGE